MKIMRLSGMACDGFSLMEILIAFVLIAVVGALSFSSFTSSKKLMQTTNNTAANVARGVMESLYESVRNDWWGSAGHPLTAGTNSDPSLVTPTVLNGVTYTPSYTVTDPPSVKSSDQGTYNTADYRRVKTTVTW